MNVSHMCIVYLKQEYVGLVEFGTQGACSIADHKSGRKGC